MAETKIEVLDKLIVLLDKIDPAAAANMMVCASGVASSMSEMSNFINTAKMSRLGRLIFAGSYGDKFYVYVDPSMDHDDVRIFDGYGKAIYNLILEGFKPEDFLSRYAQPIKTQQEFLTYSKDS